MRVRSHLRRFAAACGLAMAAAAALACLAIATGQLALVTTHGTSMEPRFHQGDLAIVRRSPSYRIGDVVAYHSHLLDTVVLHRIVARQGDRYVFKGDNNSWLDRDTPTKAELIGTLQVQIPHGGNAIHGRRGRLLGLAALGLVLTGGATSTRTIRRHRRKDSTPMPKASGSRLRVWRGATMGLAGLAAALAAIGAIAYTRPTTRTISTRAAYAQAGEFSYRADAPAGPVYETGAVRTGDPVYLRLVPALDVGFTYSFTSSAHRTVSGTIALNAEVGDGTGWTRSVPLQPATKFRGDRAEARGRLAVADIQALVAQVHAVTGMQSGVATVTLVPDVHVDGSVAGTPVVDRFQPRLHFQLDPMQLRLSRSTSNGGDTAGDDELRPRQSGVARPTRTAPARLDLFGQVDVAVTDARRVGLAAIPVAMAALLVGAVLRRRLRAQPARIELRHGRRIVPVATAARNANITMVDLTTMEDLARLADQEGSFILHHRTIEGDVYLFQTGRTVYRYTLGPVAPAGAGVA
ncbi:MAG: peptidase signal peptidase [Acidimicrobiales bacterium]|nr:peptidase signal peptidase [Acidimicrobiales bacterium]